MPYMSYLVSKTEDYQRMYRHLPLLGQLTILSTTFFSLPLLIPLISTLIFFCIPIRFFVFLTSGVNRSKTRLDGKTVLVTGGSSGIGKEISLDLARRGARVIIATRDTDEARKVVEDIRKKTGKQQVYAKYVDLSNMESVRQFARNFMDSEHRLDILINNAGLAAWEQIIYTTDEGLEKQMAINYFGPFLLTLLLIPKMKGADQARIINASSIVHWKERDLDLDNLNFKKGSTGFMKIYGVSKLCITLFTAELARRLQGTNVTVNCYHPGLVDTPIYDKQPLFAFLLFWLPRKIFFKTPAEGAQTPLYLATAEEVKDISGQYFADCRVSRTSKLAKNSEVAKKLWEKTESLLKLKDDERNV